MNGSPNTTFFQAVAKLPDLMKSVLAHDEATDFNIEIADTHNLDRKQVKAMLRIIQLVIMQILPPDQVPMRVAADLNLAGDKAKAVARDLLGLRFLPMEWYVGQVQPIIAQLGGDVQAYLNRVRPLYPEVFAGGPIRIVPADGLEAPSAAPAAPRPLSVEPPLLRDFDTYLSDVHGRGEVLLRLTGLSARVEEAMKDGRMTKEQGESLFQQLDSLSFAINNRDLNPFEVQALKRKLRQVLEAIGE